MILNTDHPHHWLLEEPQGEFSIGRCKKCGNERKFKNWIKDMDFITNTEQRIGC